MPVPAESLPNLIVIGAQKCGTSALHAYLSEHPDASMARPKELDFFASRLQRARGVRWYARHFDADKPIRGESSPSYTADALPPRRRSRPLDPHYLGVPERMHALIPGARLIYMVRDPVERVAAQWAHLRIVGIEREPLEQAVERPRSTYIARSSYGHQLERFLEHYPLEQVMVIEQEDLLRDRHETLADVFGFLGLQRSSWEAPGELRSNVTRARRRQNRLGWLTRRVLPRRVANPLVRRAPLSHPFEPPPVSEALRSRLAERLAGDVARFRELTGRRFENWSV